MIEFLRTLPLNHDGDCHLLGVDSQLTIYAEEIYGDDDWLAQYALRPDGRIVQTVDEESGSVTIRPLDLPGDVTRPAPVQHARRLDFRGPRLRGQREAERLMDVVRPLTVPTRIQLAQHLRLDPASTSIIGVAASQVLAEALLDPPDTYLVCRRLHIACALASPQRDLDGQWYDYDSIIMYAAHYYNVADAEPEMPPETVFAGLPGVDLLRPMDCQVCGGHLFVAEGGTASRPSRIHLWAIRE